MRQLNKNHGYQSALKTKFLLFEKMKGVYKYKPPKPSNKRSEKYHKFRLIKPKNITYEHLLKKRSLVRYTYLQKYSLPKIYYLS